MSPKVRGKMRVKMKVKIEILKELESNKGLLDEYKINRDIR